MPIPTTRAELQDQLTKSFRNLTQDLDAAGPELGSCPCVDNWTVQDLLAVRRWWTSRVVEWIEAGRRGETPITPAAGFGWHETPRLNALIIEESRPQSYNAIRRGLTAGYQRVLTTIDSLSDRDLLDVGVFAWAGKYPLSRWLSINTVRQYSTARTHVRRALRNLAKED